MPHSSLISYNQQYPHIESEKKESKYYVIILIKTRTRIIKSLKKGPLTAKFKFSFKSNFFTSTMMKLADITKSI